MNQIQQERLAVLEEVARRMREDDYNELPYACKNEMVKLLRTKNHWIKDLKPPRILSFIKDVADRESAEQDNKETEENNQRIKNTYIKPLEFKIKVLEIEMILFNSLFEISEITKEIHERAYPAGELEWLMKN